MRSTASNPRRNSSPMRSASARRFVPSRRSRRRRPSTSRTNAARGSRAVAAEQRPRDRELKLAPRVLGMLLEEDARAEEGDEQRRGHGKALTLRLEPVAHFVDEDQTDEPDGEPDPAEPEVGPERDEQA